MRHEFSFALTLHQVFNSAPPRSAVFFMVGKKRLYPYPKPNGLFVFPQTDVDELLVECRGYLPVTIRPVANQVSPVILYPDRWYLPPPGWRMDSGETRPNVDLFITDKSFRLRLLSHDCAANTVKIRSRRGIAGGMLSFSLEDAREAALILEKRPPDEFIVTGLKGDYSSGEVQRIYAGRSDAAGRYYLAVPEGFEKGDEAISEWAW